MMHAPVSTRYSVNTFDLMGATVSQLTPPEPISTGKPVHRDQVDLAALSS